MKNFYSILGVTTNSSNAEIKAAYRRLARKFHPDVNPDGAEIFKDICEAYETLSDEKKRSQYDTLNGFFKSTEKKPEQTFSQAHEKENSSKSFNKIFEDFGKKKKPKPIKGKDVYENVSITVQEALNGTTKVVNVLHSEECPHCKGRKFINGLVCPVCGGKGEKCEHKKISVKIPKNIKNGMKLRVPQEGVKGQNGGKNGDLYLKIKIEQVHNTKIEENNITYNIPITPCEAVLGTSISIPHHNLILKIPPKTNSGQKFRLAGQGLKSNGKVGDIIVIVRIEIPSSLSDDEIKLYEKLKKLSTQNIRENLYNE